MSRRVASIRVTLDGHPVGALVYRPALNQESWRFNSFFPAGAGRHRKPATLVAAKAKVRSRFGEMVRFADEVTS